MFPLETLLLVPVPIPVLDASKIDTRVLKGFQLFHHLIGNWHWAIGKTKELNFFG